MRYFLINQTKNFLNKPQSFDLIFFDSLLSIVAFGFILILLFAPNIVFAKLKIT